MSKSSVGKYCVLICANAEWKRVCTIHFEAQVQRSPLGDWFAIAMDISGVIEQVVFFHTGWGKVAAAAATQYVIDAWSPDLIVNLGTCGGFDGAVRRRDVILAN